MGAVETRYYGLASGTVATMRLLGQMFSMAMATIVLSIVVGRQAIAQQIMIYFFAASIPSFFSPPFSV